MEAQHMNGKRIRLFKITGLGIALMFGMILLVPTFTFAADKAELFIFFKDLCDDCHGDNPKHNIVWARDGYNHSAHKMNGNASYANGDGCQQCHTHEGFVEYTTKGKVDPKAYVQYPSQPNCNTCHNPHKTGDLSVRTAKPVSLANGKEYNMGNSNLCVNCHQVRGTAPETAKPAAAEKIKIYWGPHHGPQADMLIGTNAYEFPGKTYYSSEHSRKIGTGCIQCHMSYPQKRYGFGPELSGHSFHVKADIHHRAKLNTSGCLGNCHKEMKQVRGKDIFAYKAKADFDNDSKVEMMQEEIEGLLEHFVNKEGSGVLQKLDPPMYNPDGKWNFKQSGKQRSQAEVAALYNYKFVLEDRSMGIHNGPYAIQILYDTLEALGTNFDVSKRDAYKPK